MSDHTVDLSAISSHALHEAANALADHSRTILNWPYATDLNRLAAILERAALSRIPESRPRTRRILERAAEALEQRAQEGGAGE